MSDDATPLEDEGPGTAVAPIGSRAIVQSGPISEPNGALVKRKKDTPAEDLSRRSRRILNRRLYVADEIAANPLEDARDRMRALEFLSQTGRVADPKEPARGKVLVVKVATQHGTVEVTAASRD